MTRRPLVQRPPAGALAAVAAAALAAAFATGAYAQSPPPDQRGRIDAERSGFHDAANIRTVFWNFGMVGDYPPDPGNVDLSVFHSCEVPKGSGMNYSDGITPFVLSKIRQNNGTESYIMETGFRERQALTPDGRAQMRFEPRPGYFQPDPNINRGRSPALSNDPRTWPDTWPNKVTDPDDPGWPGSWNGYFGKRAAADQESFTVMDDNYYEAWDYDPDANDLSRRGLGLKIEVRGFQWANPQAGNVIFYHYDITNEGTVDYNENIIIGLYMDSGVGGSAQSCDGVFESDDDNAFFDRSSGLNLVFTWDKGGRGVDLSGNCGRTGYLGYAYLETPGKPFDTTDNDEDGITDERRDAGPGDRIEGQPAIEARWADYDTTRFVATYGPLARRPAYRAGVWFTGDEDMDWVAESHDTGADGVFDTNDTGERDEIPTPGEPNFDRTDLNESDQIGLTGFKMNRIRGIPPIDDILFYTTSANWPQRLYEQFTNPVPAARFDSAVASNYNIGFLFASGPFTLRAGQTERFSLALSFGADLFELRSTVKTVQQIYNANYQFAVPPALPTVTAEEGDGFVRLSWDDTAERGADPVTGEFDFEGYRIYRSTDPEFTDPKVISTGQGNQFPGNGKPSAQFDLQDGVRGYSRMTVEGVSYFLGDETGITHTWTDTTVTNGQQYFYAVCAYDFGLDTGQDSTSFYPSENAIAVSRTPRGGIILPKNVVMVRPNPRLPGYVAAKTAPTEHALGRGVGSVGVQVVNSLLVPDDHLFKITFETPSPDSVRARTYALADSSVIDPETGAGLVLFSSGRDFEGLGRGPVGAGLLPIVSTPALTEIDSAATGFREGSPTNAQLLVEYATGTGGVPVIDPNLKRPGYPEDLAITFSNDVVATSVAVPGAPARPARFFVEALTDSGPARLDFAFRDTDGNGTLTNTSEFIGVVNYTPATLDTPRVAWRLALDPAGPTSTTSPTNPLVPPAAGDVFDIKLNVPFTYTDMFVFRSDSLSLDRAAAAAQFEQEPYVVPNPYVESASFEPARFAISGRGVRRLEFRNIPLNSTIRIYTLRGELIQTLRQDGSLGGYVAWDLRTKDNLDVAPGLLIYHVDAPDIGTFVGKFAIIK